MKYFSITLCFYFLSTIQTVWAQNKFEAGYIVNAQKDTLTGFLEYGEWSQNPREICFKPKLENAPREYLPQDISSFYVHDKTYVKAAVLADKTGSKIKVSPEFPFLPVLEDTVFLLELVPGVKSLYHLKDKDNKEHFYIEKNGQMEWLIFQFYKDTLLNNAFSGGYIVDHTYKLQLFEYLDKCQEIKRKSYILSYSQKSLKSIFLRYYEKCGRRRRRW